MAAEPRISGEAGAQMRGTSLLSLPSHSHLPHCVPHPMFSALQASPHFFLTSDPMEKGLLLPHFSDDEIECFHGLPLTDGQSWD